MLFCDLASYLFLSSSNETNPGRGQFPLLSGGGESGGGSEREGLVRHRVPLEEPSGPPKGKQQQQTTRKHTNNKNVYSRMFYIFFATHHSTQYINPEQQNCKQTNLPSSPQQSLTFSNLQRYFLRHREGGITSIYMCNVEKEVLREKAKYTKFVKSLFAESEDVTIFISSDIFEEQMQKGA